MKNSNFLKKNSSLLFDKINAKEADYLFVEKSQIPDSGKGLYTSIPIYEGEIISLFKGKILSNEEAQVRAKNRKDRYFINMLDGTIMDSVDTKCFAKYANDAEGLVKTAFKLNSIITIDANENVCLVATRDLIIGEEIFCSYGKKYWKNFSKQLDQVK